ncbi:hypothetical protein ACFL27_05970 [candidate division CSSED10-310 bacterium]|uniref:Core-binding (CB) domain-containing protein n=1 Tax=candidate division CSSED10-310 bacterium TaxID=2855610 RepID=A0ABV6YU77_UNCC1
MARLGYTEGTMKFYLRQWQMLLQFAQERGEIYFSEQLGIDFVEKHFNIFEKDLNRTLSQSETQKLRDMCQNKPQRTPRAQSKNGKG